jgi:hypothetical protein
LGLTDASLPRCSITARAISATSMFISCDVRRSVSKALFLGYIFEQHEHADGPANLAVDF